MDRRRVYGLLLTALLCIVAGFVAALLLSGFFDGSSAGTTAAAASSSVPSVAQGGGAGHRPRLRSDVGRSGEGILGGRIRGGRLPVPPPPPVCGDTCAHARDGVCDEGRGKQAEASGPMSKAAVVKCDLGSDCADCGEWQPTGPPPWDTTKGNGPISLLMSKNVSVNVKRTSLPKVGKPEQDPFLFAYTDPTKDTDVSLYMNMNGMVEASITKIFFQVFEKYCISPSGSRALFVDVGANFGWYSVLAASMGCRVLAFEPVPHFRAFLEYSVALNGLGHLVDVRSEVVSHVSNETLTLVVPSRGYWGTAGIDGLNIDNSIPGATFESMNATSVRLADVVKEDVLMLKVDVEGWEWSVMLGAKGLLDRHNVRNIIMEYSPGVPERTFRTDDIIRTVEMVVNLVDRSYKVAHLGEGKGASEMRSPMEEYEEVLAQNLKYDMYDAKQFKHAMLGCPPPEPRPAPNWSCMSLPEDVSPRSLRSMLGHNTNLWLAKDEPMMRLRGHVGMIKLSDPLNKFTIDHTLIGVPYGMGMRPCAGIQPAFQVRHRCKCTDMDVCGKEEGIALELSEQQKMPSNYQLPP
ncbi:hypothetical protein FOA52_013144 [Chlamydomonas sp. UWO 241]|nr:hypothetical protein FOA52_013144 [Chlamydomonas sp. UWO 241]